MRFCREGLEEGALTIGLAVDDEDDEGVEGGLEVLTKGVKLLEVPLLVLIIMAFLVLVVILCCSLQRHAYAEIHPPI